MQYVVKPARGVGGLDLPGVWAVYADADPLVAVFTCVLRSACDDFAWAMNQAAASRAQRALAPCRLESLRHQLEEGK